HLVAWGIPASQQCRLGHRDSLFQVRLDPFDVLVGLSNNVVDRRLEPSVGRELIADVGARALRHISRPFRMSLGPRLQAAKVSPEVLEDDRTAMERYPETAGITNHGWEIVVAIVGCIREKCLLRGVIDKGRALGKTIEGTLILGTHQTTRARFLNHLVNPLK